MLSRACLREEGVKGIIALSYWGVGWHLAVRLDTMLKAVEFPTGIAHLNTSLAKVDWQNFPHFFDDVTLATSNVVCYWLIGTRAKIISAFIIKDKVHSWAQRIIHLPLPKPNAILDTDLLLKYGWNTFANRKHILVYLLIKTFTIDNIIFLIRAFYLHFCVVEMLFKTNIL